MTIHCVTPNPAIDVTYRVNSVTLHEVNRIIEVSQRPGGKGVNVARILSAQGVDVATYGFLGGTSGQLLRDLLRDLAPTVDQRWTAVVADTRRTIALVDAHGTTMLNEPGNAVTGDAWAQLIAELTARCRVGDVVTVSGSLPLGTAPENLSGLITGAQRAGATVIVDTSGPGLLLAAEAGADVLKPNREELLASTGMTDIDQAMASLLHRGARALIVSLGEDGLLLSTGQGTASARLDRVLRGNPTGAGDALVAALAAGLAAAAVDAAITQTLKDSLVQAVAWSAAAVLALVAGEIDTATAEELKSDVVVKES